MDRKKFRALVVSAAFLAALGALGYVNLGGDTHALAGNARHGSSGDLFYNYYSPPGYGGLSAELYPCPRPTPPLVGHTYITYQPLMPHEFLYEHARTYVRKTPGAGRTRTTVTWK
jgi:hypothetical protein